MEDKRDSLFTVIPDDETPDEKFILKKPDIDLNTGFENKQNYTNYSNYNISPQQNVMNNTFIKEEIEKDTIKQTLAPQILFHPNGTIYYILHIPNVYKTNCIQLLNVCNYHTCLYYSKHNKEEKILIVKCNLMHNHNLFIGKNLCIIFNYDDKLKGKDFFQKLINSGITSFAASKYKNDIANALLSYSIHNAYTLEIPYSYGWWKNSEKEWKFADKNDLTIKYIQENKTDEIKLKTHYKNSYTVNDDTLNKNKFLILISLAVNYPVLKEYGMELSKPLLIIVDKGQMKTAIDILSEKDTQKLNTSIKKGELVKIMTETNSDFVVYPYIQSKESDKFLSTINDIVLTSEIDGNKINAMPVIISENFPCGYDIENFFTVCIEGNLEDIQVDKMVVVPPEKYLPTILSQIDNEIINSNSFSHDKKVLMAAVYFLYPNLKNKIDDYKNLAELLIEENNNNYYTNSLEYFFIEELFKWQKSTAFHNISQLPYPENNALENIEGTIFFDEDYVYMHENIFKKITEKFKNIININRLKKKLDDEGILYKENTNTYTVKMCYYKDEMLDRKRMLRFYRSKLYKKEVGFIETCQEI